jgi:hypothetical protein
MAARRRLIAVEDGLWNRTREAALREGVKVPEVVARALRAYLTTLSGPVGPESGSGRSSVESSREKPPAADAGDGGSGLARARAAGVLVTGRELLNGVKPKPVEGLQRRLDVTGVAGGKATVETVVETPRERERRIAARQNWLRTHPEDESQDPGF